MIGSSVAQDAASDGLSNTSLTSQREGIASENQTGFLCGKTMIITYKPESQATNKVL